MRCCRSSLAALLAAQAALSSAGLTLFLKEAIDSWFVESFKELLEAIYPTRARISGVRWEEAEVVLRRHVVTGGLDGRERRRLWEEHVQGLRASSGERRA